MSRSAHDPNIQPHPGPNTWLLDAISRLPLGVLHLASSAAAAIAPLILGRIMRRVDANLALAFPDQTEPARRKLARAFLRNIADVMVETIKGASMPLAQLSHRVRMTNPEVLEAYAAKNQSIVLLGSHEANWEWVSITCGAGMSFDIQGAYKPLPDTALDAFLKKARTRFGATLFAPEAAGQALVDGRKKLRAIAVIADERPSNDEPSRWVTFLGQDTPFRTSFETLAELWRYPVVFISRRRVARGRYEVTFIPLAEPPYPPKASRLVEAYAAALEASIRANPADWLWTQRRWTMKKPLYD